MQERHQDGGRHQVLMRQVRRVVGGGGSGEASGGQRLRQEVSQRVTIQVSVPVLLPAVLGAGQVAERKEPALAPNAEHTAARDRLRHREGDECARRQRKQRSEYVDATVWGRGMRYHGRGRRPEK